MQLLAKDEILRQVYTERSECAQNDKRREFLSSEADVRLLRKTSPATCHTSPLFTLVVDPVSVVIQSVWDISALAAQFRGRPLPIQRP